MKHLLRGMFFVGLLFCFLQGFIEEVKPENVNGDTVKYVGAKACKKCHNLKSRGAQYSSWEETDLAKAYHTLASDKATEIAKAKGINDPQTNEACVKCHVTGHGVDPSRFAETFNKEMGVQCESCHGPAEKHVKARSENPGRSVPDDVLKGEISMPTEQTCVRCHNAESPSYKEFNFKEASQKIEHSNPKRKK